MFLFLDFPLFPVVVYWRVAIPVIRMIWLIDGVNDLNYTLIKACRVKIGNIILIKSSLRGTSKDKNVHLKYMSLLRKMIT